MSAPSAPMNPAEEEEEEAEPKAPAGLCPTHPGASRTHPEADTSTSPWRATDAGDACPLPPPESALRLSPYRSRHSRPFKRLFTFLHAIFHLFPAPPLACRWLARPPGQRSNYLLPSAGARVLTGTLFGQRKGHVHFAVQDNPHAPPLLLLELATPTNTLVKEMASGLVRIALECERTQNRGKLLLERVWTMYCNGRKTGYAIRRECSEADLQVFSLVRAVSMGAGVLPTSDEGLDGELMYMRARFERIVGSRDSEAFYMMNPDGTGGPELSIFLLRI